MNQTVQGYVQLLLSSSHIEKGQLGIMFIVTYAAIAYMYLTDTFLTISEQVSNRFTSISFIFDDIPFFVNIL